MTATMFQSLCESCVFLREVVTARSRFLLCQRSRTDSAFPKYPPQPVVQCVGYEVAIRQADQPKQQGS